MEKKCVLLKDISLSITDGTHSTVKDDPTGRCFLLSCKNIKNGKIIIGQSERRIKDHQLQELKKRTNLNKNDILITTVGTIGEMAMIEEENPLFDFQRSVGIIKADSNLVCPRYLFYALKNELPQIFSLVKGAVQQCLFLGDIKQIRLQLPTLNNQIRIAAVLESIDKKIRINEKINDNLLQQASSIYQAWFEDFVLSDGTCPSDWKQGSLSDIADITSGKRPPVKSAEKTDTTVIPLVGAASVMGYTTEANHTDKILVTGRVGTHGVVQRFNSPCWTSDNTLVIISDLYEYTFQILQRIDYHAMNRGSTQPLITQGDMNKVSILIPDKETLSNFETLVGQLMEQYEANLLENVKLAELRDTLLPRLMSGELDVSELDI